MRDDLLTLSRENRSRLHENGIGRDALLSQGYSATDYNFWVTPGADLRSKYAVGAFYSADEQNEGARRIREMDRLINRS